MATYKLRELLRLMLGGMVAGGFLGVLVGSVAGMILGACLGDLDWGLDGALLGAGILAVCGGVLGSTVAISGRSRRSSLAVCTPEGSAETSGRKETSIPSGTEFQGGKSP